MLRACLIILIVQFGLMLHGCAALEYLDGSSGDEVKKFEMSKDEMWNEIKKLKIENADLERQIHILREENQSIRYEHDENMARMTGQNELLNEQMSALQEENQRLTDENQILGTKLTQLQQKHETLSSKSYEVEEEIRKLRMKVLSGDGDLNSAREMAKKLRQMGYTIELIHPAPRSDFSHTILFATGEYQDEARRLATTLGGKTICKPLTWSSVFDLIVVTGKGP